MSWVRHCSFCLHYSTLQQNVKDGVCFIKIATCFSDTYVCMHIYVSERTYQNFSKEVFLNSFTFFTFIIHISNTLVCVFKYLDVSFSVYHVITVDTIVVCNE